MAGVALAALGWLWWRAWASVGRDAAPLCVAGLGDIDVPLCVAGAALGDIHLHFAWQAWHLWHWAGSGGAIGRTLVARGAAPLCMAGVALGDATYTFTLRGRRGAW